MLAVAAGRGDNEIAANNRDGWRTDFASLVFLGADVRKGNGGATQAAPRKVLPPKLPTRCAAH